ncbi:hypothetical protein [Nitrospira sp. BLG_2]|uniref:hypothetical protein n=1 Tax=Nitrospira sp. BLG_2 TaxID=3397507 RepID=UPI003B9A0571
MATIHDLSWWYRFLTGGLLGAGLLGWPAGIFLAMLWSAVQIVNVIWLTRHYTAFPAQVRIGYLEMLIAGLWGPLQWIYWMLLAGITVRLPFGYCLLGRILSLAPWNRWQPFSFPFVRRTFLSPQAPVPPCGEVFRRMSLERVQG